MFIDNEYAVISILVLFVLILLVRNIMKLRQTQEGLCVDPVKCGSGLLVDAYGNPFSGRAQPMESVEPRDPYLTSSMVVPTTLANVNFEKNKFKYLTDANRVYMDIENDTLNRDLLPRGLLFAA